MNILGLQHIGIPTTCYRNTIEFYSSLGFTSAYHGMTSDGRNINFMRVGDMTLEIIEKTKTAKEYGAVDHFALDVEDIKAWYDNIKVLGHTILEDEIQTRDFWINGVSFFTIEGPNKEKVEFSQYL